MIRVYVDTSIVRYADQKREFWCKHKETIRQGAGTEEIEILRRHTEYPLEKLNTEEHKRTHADALLIPQIEEIAKGRLILLCWNLETHLEYTRKRHLGSPPAPELISLIAKANPPLDYGRPLVSPFGQVERDEQLEFLRRTRHPSFETWKKLVGVQPGTKHERSQLMDAWHLWSADHNRCDYFLTMDYKVIGSVASRKRVSSLRLVAPTQFLGEFKVLRPAAELELTAGTTTTQQAR